MASTQSLPPLGSTAASNPTPDTVIPKSYARGIGMTPDPWEECARLEYGGDRSYAWSVNQQVVQATPASQAKVEEHLRATLALPGCTEAGRDFLCRMFALVGSAKSVPALAPLLRDPKTTEAARFALEAIPGAEADAALRAALSYLSGNAKAGLIGSIAARRDSAARPVLAALKDDHAEPAIVREAATHAFECLSSP